MRNPYAIVLATAMLILFLASCDKTAANKDYIVGEWNIDRITSKTYKNDSLIVLQEDTSAKTITFNGDGTGTYVHPLWSMDPISFQWVLNEHTLTWTEGGVERTKVIGGKEIKANYLKIQEAGEEMDVDGNNFRYYDIWEMGK